MTRVGGGVLQSYTEKNVDDEIMWKRHCHIFKKCKLESLLIVITLVICKVSCKGQDGFSLGF